VDRGTGVTGEVDAVVVVNTMSFGSQAAYHVHILQIHPDR
jgi:hypothetical protein